MLKSGEDDSIVVSALRARANFVPGIRDYVRLTAPEPDVLKATGEESRRKGTDALTSRDIHRIIEATRAQKKKR